MNDNAKRWVVALRSGEYRQGKGQLRSGDQFCCLGVACDLYAKEVGGAGWKGNHFVTYKGVRAVTILPDVVTKWIGLGRPDGLFINTSVASLNDSGMTFTEIADIIEANADLLFRKEE